MSAYGLHEAHAEQLFRFLLAQATECRESALLHAWAGNDAHAERHRGLEAESMSCLAQLMAWPEPSDTTKHE